MLREGSPDWAYMITKGYDPSLLDGKDMDVEERYFVITGHHVMFSEFIFRTKKNILQDHLIFDILIVYEKYIYEGVCSEERKLGVRVYLDTS